MARELGVRKRMYGCAGDIKNQFYLIRPDPYGHRELRLGGSVEKDCLHISPSNKGFPRYHNAHKLVLSQNARVGELYVEGMNDGKMSELVVRCRASVGRLTLKDSKLNEILIRNPLHDSVPEDFLEVYATKDLPERTPHIGELNLYEDSEISSLRLGQGTRDLVKIDHVRLYGNSRIGRPVPVSDPFQDFSLELSGYSFCDNITLHDETQIGHVYLEDNAQLREFNMKDQSKCGNFESRSERPTKIALGNEYNSNSQNPNNFPYLKSAKLIHRGEHRGESEISVYEGLLENLSVYGSLARICVDGGRIYSIKLGSCLLNPENCYVKNMLIREGSVDNLGGTGKIEKIQIYEGGRLDIIRQDEGELVIENMVVYPGGSLKFTDIEPIKKAKELKRVPERDFGSIKIEKLDVAGMPPEEVLDKYRTDWLTIGELS